jgi:RNA polymerase sigma-70 factor (ECF subfamily)
VPDAVRTAIEQAHRSEWGRVLAATARLTRDLDLAEDCVEDAYLTALKAWQRDGVPTNPGAWLTTAARRRALDILRRHQTLQNKYRLLVEPAAEEEPEMDEPDEIPDERLRLIFTCCHPALAQEAQIGLTLRLLCGLTTSEIASMFLVPLPTVAARITRAKKKIEVSRIPYRVPEPADLPERLSSVLSVVYLIYSAGHTSPEGEDIHNPVLIERALDLARALLALMPDEREVRGLLALILLSEARQSARLDAAGELVLLEDQDRSLWDKAKIAEGSRLVESALRGGNPGRYAIQAAIAALHAEAASWEETDWPQIALLYDVLYRIWPTPVVALNRISARSMVIGPEAALAELADLEGNEHLVAYVYLPATKADLLRRLERHEEAAEAYQAALTLVTNSRERRFLERRLAEMSRGGVEM